MKKRTLGGTDINASVVGFGGIPIQGLSFAEAQRVLLHACDSGIDFFDTARGYTDSEEKIGRALGSRRDSIYLASKAMSRDAAGMQGELETSLRNLRTEMIDLYQFHAVGSDEQLERILGTGGAYETLSKARDEGKVRWIGITGHSREILGKAVETGMFDTVQFPLNAIETEWEGELVPLARKGGMGTLGMKPLAGGALADAAAAIRFTLVRGIDVSIPGMAAVEQVDANVKASDLAPPSREELEYLAKEKEAWGELFCRRCGYCMPCPEGLNIPFLLLLEGYYNRYELKDWAVSRLRTQENKYSDCIECGTCLEKCPYSLPVPELMKRAGRLLEG
jgi:predicted aldo/keto reductase-like oxidoreductase